MRISPSEKNDPKNPPIQPFFSKFRSETEWIIPPKTPSKIVLLVIDALRIDFVLPYIGSDAPVYANKLTVLADIARRDPLNSSLSLFLADAPTVTTQRLSGITGGILPTFIEAGDNFSSGALSVDNIVHQLLFSTKFKRLNFFGDDTWLHLFPEIVTHSVGSIKGYHSFDMFDLHTVDNGIKENLFPKLQSSNYDIIVAHFLGVDHCGHKFGPLHIECAKKLKEMDSIIREVIDYIDDDTALIVMGDHGMTDSGDHGGNSFNEVSSALFFYRKNSSNFSGDLTSVKPYCFQGKFIHDDQHMKFFDTSLLSPLCSQIDFAATFSLLFGLAVPFCNLGSFIPGSLVLSQESSEERLRWQLDAVRMNAYQLLSYISALAPSAEFDEEYVSKCRNSIKMAESRLIEYMDSNSTKDLYLALNSFYEFLNNNMNYCRSVWATVSYFGIIFGLVMMIFGLIVMSWNVYGFQQNWPFWLLILGFFGSRAANSFIINENYLVIFIFNSTLICESRSFFSASLIMPILIISRLTALIHTCREEQGILCWAFDHRTIAPNSWMGIGLLLLCLSSTLFSCRQYKSLSSLSLVLLLNIYLTGFWWIEQVPQLEQYVRVYLPRFIFTFSACGIFVSFFKPDYTEQFPYPAILMAVSLRPFGAWCLLLFRFLINDLLDYSLQRLSDVQKVFLVYLYCFLLYFATGHNASITNIHWDAAFVGSHHLNQVLGGFLILLNTFSGPLLGCLAFLHAKSNLQKYFFMLASCDLIVQALSLCLLLRHLMLWKVFAPRFLLQVAHLILYFLYLTTVLVLQTISK